MGKKIIIRFLAMSLLAALLATILTAFLFYQRFEEQVKSDLKTSGDIIAQIYNSGNENLDLALLTPQQIRITLMTADGQILFDNKADIGSLEHHLNLPEITQVSQYGTAEGIRHSDTLGSDIYYYIQTLNNGNILQVATEAGNLYRYYSQAYPLIFLMLLGLTALAILLAILLTRNLLKPLKQMEHELDQMQKVPEDAKLYPELVPFVKEIQAQRLQIELQLKTIEGEKEKLEAIIADKTQMEQMRQEFTANVSHELKTPLTSISGYAEMIENGMAKQDDVQRFATIIHKEAGRLLTLISDIIQLSAMDESKTVVAKTPVDLLELAEECADILTLSAEQHQVSLHVQGKRTTVMGNHDLLAELIYNLCDNAIRYNKPNGSVTILVRKNRITVKDTGIGIPAEHQSRVFERFYRVDKSRSKETGGTGLGLAIVKHIAEQHKAKIDLQSAPETGTEITVRFPEE